MAGDLPLPLFVSKTIQRLVAAGKKKESVLAKMSLQRPTVYTVEREWGGEERERESCNDFLGGTLFLYTCHW